MDIYLYDGYLYFSRSWTGDLGFRAKINFQGQAAHVDIVEAQAEGGEDYLVVLTRPIFCTNRSESLHRSLGL